MPYPNAKTECRRCGTCCLKGGPALHYKDRRLLQNGCLNPEQLITIRKGEPVFYLDGEKPAPAASEIIKVKAAGSEWTCLFFDEKNAYCTIYEYRPIECLLLKCWDTGDLKKISGRDLLNRSDIIAVDDPVLPFVETHERQCSLEKLAEQLLALDNEEFRQQTIDELTVQVKADLALRLQAFAKCRFSLALELFYFGRPLFKILAPYGVETHEENGVCRLSLSSSN